jgi:hypothetical protein
MADFMQNVQGCSCHSAGVCAGQTPRRYWSVQGCSGVMRARTRKNNNTLRIRVYVSRARNTPLHTPAHPAHALIHAPRRRAGVRAPLAHPCTR